MSDSLARVALIGLRCVGKTSVGRELARLCGATCVDLDAELARGWDPGPGEDPAPVAGAGDVLARIGEERFRRLELQVLEGLFRDSGPARSILATGGGCVETPAARELLGRHAWVVWLREDPSRLAARLELDPVARPSLTGADPAAEFREIAARREPLYASIARARVECDGEGIEAVARRVLAVLPAGWSELPGPRG